jgi:hypothetical protein
MKKSFKRRLNINELRMKMIIKEAEYKGIKTIINKKNTEFLIQLHSVTTNSAAAPKGSPTGEDERHRPRRNLSSTAAAIACQITCPVSAALSYGKGKNGR